MRMNRSNEQGDLIADAMKVLGHAPFGVCLLDEQEHVIWTNETLRSQLGMEGPAGQSSSEHLDDLPFSVERPSGLCQPTLRPGMRLRMAITPLRDGVRLAAFTDVTDLTSGAAGYVEVLREIANTDSVTGLRNRQQINRDLLTEINRSRRYGNALSLLAIKLAGKYPDLSNDQKEEALRTAGVKLADNLRAIDYAGQYSDSEFLAVLPETDEQGAHRLADKILGVLSPPDGVVAECKVVQWQASDDAATLLERAGLR